MRRIASGIYAVMLLLAVLGLLAGPVPLAGQTAAAEPAAHVQPASSTAAAASVPWFAVPTALPPSLAPAAEDVEDSELIQDGNGPLPYIFGIFGGIAGMFVADWWEDRNCADSCGQANIPMLFLGGGLGAIIGYLIGGGELPIDAPPGR